MASFFSCLFPGLHEFFRCPARVFCSGDGGDDEEAGDARGLERGQVAFFDAAANDDGDGTLYSERAEFFEGAQVARTVSEQAGVWLRRGRMEGARAEVVNDGKIAGMDRPTMASSPRSLRQMPGGTSVWPT